MDFSNFTYRKESVPAKEIFPHINVSDLRKRFGERMYDDPHEEIFYSARNLWDHPNGYDYIIRTYGFHDEYKTFSGHCHQITPALGIVLKAKGFENVQYLECYRVREHNGAWTKVSPAEEWNPKRREEFTSLNRIPYCCLGVEVSGELFYLTGKHIRRVHGTPTALLTPACYREFVSVFPHQNNSEKSGIYLKTVQTEPFTWMKETTKDPEPEFFQVFARMTLEL